MGMCVSDHGVKSCSWIRDEEIVAGIQSEAEPTNQIYQLTDLAIGRRPVALLVVHPAKHPGQVLGGGTHGANGTRGGEVIRAKASKHESINTA